ncbi:hypothetical protein BGX27_002395 [Mortierella sp. AM989]|nr:hypothetical protein BGX27_002395 [Mortierella sp. AM989]
MQETIDHPDSEMLTYKDLLSNVLRDTHARNLLTYKRLLSDVESSMPQEQCVFWDIVVVTAGDYQQRLVYERQIDRLIAQKRIPTRAKYHIIDDPPGSKIGSGGSTFLVMKTLIYTNRTAHILLIHAGGYSTRLPHVSARGKVFMTLPQADDQDGIQVLDLKLALYLHFLETMPPGVFLTSADGIELFSSKLPFPSELKPFTITALAHPSSTWIGSTHGVYLLQDPDVQILKDRKLEPKDQSALLLKCKQFLHKPSLDVMKSTPNVIHTSSATDAEDIVYTDSCYYFDPQTAKVMANTYKNLDAECDLEAWADILCFQDCTPPAFTSTSSTSNPHLQARQIVKQAFQESGVALDVMVLNASKFYHLGTMQEFLEGACTDLPFMAELNIRNQDTGIACVGPLSSFGLKDEKSSKEEERITDSATAADIHPPIYIENSSIAPSATIHPGSIIVDSDIPSEAVIPRNTCIFTLQLQEHEFVTFTFSVKDDMKRAVGSNMGAEETLQEIKIFERVPISVALSLNALPPPELMVGGLSLWTAPVFEIAETKQESVRFGLSRLDRIRRYLADEEQGRATASEGDGNTSESSVIGWTSLKVAARRAREY